MQELQPLKIFIVYAREDAEALKELRAQFIPVARSERLEVWYDGEILPGQHWDKEIKTQLRSADIILLFISKYFFASEYIQSTELKEALERHEVGKSVVVPVIVRPCAWQDAFDVSKFQALPANANPIFSSHWRDPDEAMVSVVEGVKKVARRIKAERIQKEATKGKQVEDERGRQGKEVTERLARLVREQRRVAEAKPFPTRMIVGIGAGLLGLLLTWFLVNKFSREQQTDLSKNQPVQAQPNETMVNKNPESPPVSETANRKLGLEMVRVEGGIFNMGQKGKFDPNIGCKNCSADECGHTVMVNSFSIGKYEVTQSLWRETMGYEPALLSLVGCDQCPVEGISWNDVQSFLKILNKKTGKNYRLPTEEEWEFAAQGGIQSSNFKYAGSNDIGLVAWYDKNSGPITHPVGWKKANELGLFDMSGNVWEWCAYNYKTYPCDSKRMWSSQYCLRGGSWNYHSFYCRIAYRRSCNPASGNIGCGFRLAQN